MAHIKKWRHKTMLAVEQMGRLTETHSSTVCVNCGAFPLFHKVDNWTLTGKIVKQTAKALGDTCSFLKCTKNSQLLVDERHSIDSMGDTSLHFLLTLIP
jgi:hypothetical protein